jgi:N6-adenosine-specific RNA methylase IME4
MRTTLSGEGQIVLPAQIRQQDRIKPGQQFDIEPTDRGEYRLLREESPRDEGGSTGCLLIPQRVCANGRAPVQERAQAVRDEKEMISNFVIDPPWPKKKGGKRSVRPNQGRLLDYPTLAVPDIFALLDHEVLTLAAAVHNVFLWGIEQFLHAGEEQMRRRGYKLHARFIWDKGNGVAPAFTVRYSHEYLSWFYKPKLLPVQRSQRGSITTVIRAPQRQHSRKPDEAYHIVESLYPDLPRMDVFSREKRPGWEQHGNQIDHFS